MTSGKDLTGKVFRIVYHDDYKIIMEEDTGMPGSAVAVIKPTDGRYDDGSFAVLEVQVAK